jgi:DNA-binding SARP family transcriptional activator
MIYVKVLGPTLVEVDGQPVADTALGGRLRQVLEILALEAGRPVAKEVLADHVWDGSPPPTYVGTLESYVCVLRKRLGLTGGRKSALATRDHGYVLGGDEVRVDVDRFRTLTRPAPGLGDREQVHRAVEALDVVRGPLLASEPYAAWAAAARELFDRDLAESLTRAAGVANRIGDHDAARRLARRVVEREPYCEAAWQQLIRAHWLAGERGEALRDYAGLREMLLDGLGEQPSAESQDLYLAVLRSQDETRRATEPQELDLLLRLLRQALEGVPGIRVPRHDAALATTAVRVLAQTA